MISYPTNIPWEVGSSTLRIAIPLPPGMTEAKARELILHCLKATPEDVLIALIDDCECFEEIVRKQAADES